MKTLNNYINEALIKKDTKISPYKYFPKNKEELKRGPNANLNDIDTSEITDMSGLFKNFYIRNIDISDWDVSNVKDMSKMFADSNFNSDISKWDVSNVENMKGMFQFSNFNQNISNLNVSSVKYMTKMFASSDFNQDISQQDVSNVEDMSEMFRSNSHFYHNLDNWNVNQDTNIKLMFIYSKLELNPPRWWYTNKNK